MPGLVLRDGAIIVNLPPALVNVGKIAAIARETP
jgi:hypothetical protein